jgi:GNAT superfamily N-acetyltransferase
MALEFQQIGPQSLLLYASVPISFNVRARLLPEPVENGLGGIRLVEEPVNPPYIKDYDVDELPMDWPNILDVRNWAFFLVYSSDNRPVGAATVAYDTPGVHMLEGRKDMSVLWDIRIHPEFRGQGIGAQLFKVAEDWSRSRGTHMRQMKIETQTINVPACRFYAAMGCQLGGIDHFAYPSYPDETMLLWYKNL